MPSELAPDRLTAPISFSRIFNDCSLVLGSIYAQTYFVLCGRILIKDVFLLCLFNCIESS